MKVHQKVHNEYLDENDHKVEPPAYPAEVST